MILTQLWINAISFKNQGNQIIIQELRKDNPVKDPLSHSLAKAPPAKR